MPILEHVVNPGEPLSQGDLLKDVPLFHTAPQRQGGFAAEDAESEFCLVLSRPCVANHKECIVVAAVIRYTKQRPDFEDFEEALEFYEDARDGKSSPDRFYIGQIEGFLGSYCARFDSIHTIEVPKDGGKRAAFVAAHRIGRLVPDFARDLHQRMFRAFASLGFEDNSWYSTDDLKAIVIKGDSELLKAQSEQKEIELKLQTGKSQAFPNETDQSKFEKELAQKNKKVDGLQRKLHPLKEELAKREGQAKSADTGLA